MKILFVYPRFQKFLDSISEEDRKFLEPILGGFTTPPSLGIPILAALTPSEHEVFLLDDNLGDPVDPDIDVDLVAINCFTPQATRAFELGDLFRKHGKTVVMGGIFPSAMPDEAAQHADSVNVGEGEPTWVQILSDFQNGCLKPLYKGGCRLDMAKMPIPDRTLFYENSGYDWHSALVQTARGCGYNCAMCVIPQHFGHRIRFRPVQNIINEIKSLPYEQIYLADDTVFLTDRKSLTHATELFERLKPLKKRIFISSTLALNTDPEFLKLVADAGGETFYCTLNVDPISMKALSGRNSDARHKLKELVSRVTDLGMNFYASYGIGRDWDDESIGDQILEMSLECGIDIAEFFVFTPFPGSIQYTRMTSQNRILHHEWEKFNGAHVVYRPHKMSVEKLEEVFIGVWRDFYKDRRHDWVLERLGKHTSDSPHPDHEVPELLREPETQI